MRLHRRRGTGAKISQTHDSRTRHDAGGLRGPLFPQTRFAATGIDAQVDFHTDDEGNVASLTLFQGGQEVPARKTE